ncbi:porin family protein [uncultured Alcanivorax sp.]|uniref:porin family protein n=1 Tax=uncultured Alcanivorax sp. TaxID=191215 RepID=UPI002604DEB8|nr:porin family protein [uncultured Alcanivorax sp.]
MKKLCASLVLCGLGVVSANSYADGYLAVGYAQLEQNDRFFGDDRFDTGDLVAKLGADISKYFGAEMRLGTTVISNEESVAGGDLEYRQNYFYGGYLRARWSNKTALTPYAVLGIAHAKETLDTPAGSFNDDWNDTSYGAGVDLDITDSLAVNAEYVLYRDMDNVTIKGPAASLVWRF